MKHRQYVIPLMLLGAAFVGLSGCSSIDRLGTKMDMAVGRLSEPGQHVYEGRLQNVQRVGSMVAIQFAGGTYYDVVEAPAGLKPGDLVRIYKVDQGYEAHLWRESTE